MGRRARIDQNKKGDSPSQLNALVPEQLLLKLNRACVASRESRDGAVEEALNNYLERKPPKRASVRQPTKNRRSVAFLEEVGPALSHDECVAALREVRHLAKKLLEATEVVAPLLRVAGRR